MSIRIRMINGRMIALCAARSVHKKGDIYLDDNSHAAVSQKFFRDYKDSFNVPNDLIDHAEKNLADIEESNNENRDDWEDTFGTNGKLRGQRS